ncbi:hypothetical protein [Actinomycetospora chibensis]|uniref:Uncharacterized protein n=1 Tax=Actinomycetospora chibensis TaxID=663606 RepID=A0ABV9RR95_9PSEU|nr:hypothetical protein [Actinomycetospora chibensis]MDD7927493.1 hypothetical protein [Actinomycetospora chibensis]
MADGTTAPRPHLAAVPAEAATRTPALPAEEAQQPYDAPDLLAALDAGDEEAVRAWFRAHSPDPASLLIYGLYLGAGLVGLMEWPAVLLGVAGQVVVDRRFGGVEALAAEMRAKLDGALPARS